ncbi:MAG: gliding motility-associated C-terminal domain-containing protein [Bacteroidetes bacterium]|nr:gliding motility-associated C-terminal domain-containing protein [Bacteroidota bacterium]
MNGSFATYIYILLAQLAGFSAFAQTPYVVNAAGSSSHIPLGYFAYNIGEPVIGTAGNYYTQGFLQPNFKVLSALTVSLTIVNERCEGSNDASLVISVGNNVGHYNYLLFDALGDTVNSLVNGHLSPGSYTFSATDSIGQSYTQHLVVPENHQACDLIHVHNAFSPNGDGLNEVFVIDGIENFPNNKVSIFNRWGQDLWNQSKYDNVNTFWNGQDKSGNKLVSGTYFYIIEIDGKNPLKGWVELTR